MTGGAMDEKKAKVPIIVLSALLAVAVGVIVFLAVGNQKKLDPAAEAVSVPNVTLADQKEADKILTHAGLKLGNITEQNDDTVPARHVVSQNPKAGTKVERGSAIDLVVSRGKEQPVPVTVPDLKGMAQEDAEKALTDAKLVPVPGNPVYSDEVDPGRVCTQSVAAGTTLNEGSQVVFSTSLGKETTTVPDVTGQNIDQARSTLNDAGLGVDTTTAYSDSVAKDCVISQSIAKDTKVAKGTIVTLRVSLGAKPATKVVVPNILTHTLDDAKEALDSAGLTYSYTGDVDGTVDSVNPAPGTEVDQGSMVTFTLQHHASLVAVPDVSGMNGTDAKAAIEQAGLKLEYDHRHPDRVLSGTDPIASTMVDVGTIVKATYDPEPQPQPDPGSWKTNTQAESHVTDDQKATFNKAVNSSSNGVAAESTTDSASGSQAGNGQNADAQPIAVVASQVTSGTNYAYLGYKDGTWCVFEIAVDTDGNPTLVSTHNVDVANVQTTDATSGDVLPGGWAASDAETGTLEPKEVADAFSQAMGKWTGVSLKPIALLGSQVVDGTNYRILCAGSAVAPKANTQLYVATINVDANGTASVSDVSGLNLGGYLG